MTSVRDIGKQAVEQIAAMWQVDPARSVQREDGFEWWPGDFRVAVTAHRRPDGSVPECWCLTIRTDFLKDVPVDNEKFVQLTALSAHVAALTCAWVYPPAELLQRYGIAERPKLWLANSAYVTAETADWLPHFLASMGLMQPTNAQIQAAGTAEIIQGGSPDVSSPRGMKLEGLDGMLDVAELVFAPRGNEANRWIGTGEFEETAETWGRSDLCFGIGDPQELTLETPFGEASALIRLRTSERHPQLGTGLLGTIQLPIENECNAVAHECARLNFMETLWTDIPLFGCWSPHQSLNGRYAPAFTSFIPNALYRPGLATNMALWLFARARWVRMELFPQLRDRAMAEILKERAGIAGDMSDQIRSDLH
jgi:hypothetical protein